MSEASGTVPTSSAPAGSGREQRRVRNYLLDKRFQLKYAGYLAGIAFVVSVVLGTGLWITSTKLLEQSRTAVEQGKDLVRQGQETVKRGQLVIEQSKKVSAVVAMNIAKEYKDEPELAKTFGEEATRDEAKLKEEQERLERDASVLKLHAADLEKQSASAVEQQRALLVGIVVAMALLVALIGLAGIVVTHKVAGPVFKMKRMFRQVGEGKLSLRERLRKGDELQDFFEAFDQMLGSLRDRQRAKIDRLDQAIAQLEGESKGEGVALLKELRKEMLEQVDG